MRKTSFSRGFADGYAAVDCNKFYLGGGALMRRVAGAMLFGLGLLCVVAAAALAWLIVPALKKVPYDLVPPKTVLNAPGATFVSARLLPGNTPSVAVEQATLRNTTGVKPDYEAAANLSGDLAGNTLIWNV